MFRQRDLGVVLLELPAAIWIGRTGEAGESKSETHVGPASAFHD